MKSIYILVWGILLGMSFIGNVMSQNITSCSFYVENSTCEDLLNRCTSEATGILKVANFGLQKELDACKSKFIGREINTWVTGVSILVAIVLLVWRIKERSKLKKKK